MAAILPLHEDGIARAAEGAVERLIGLVEGDLARVNEVIVARMTSPVPLIPELAGHLVMAGGKRLRPLITLASARLCSYAGDAHIKLAAAVEFVHTATLLHDDVVDASALRRGRASANVIWGNEASVLVGDFLFSRAFQLMVETGSLEVLGILSGASAIIAEGEVMQLASQNNLGTGEETYLSVIRAKTAALFEAAAKMGAVVAGRSQAETAALGAYGQRLGMAFQLVDDALDYSGREAKLGKMIGDDFREGKVTLPVIFAHEKADGDAREFWQRTVGAQKQTPSDLAHAIKLIEESGALSRTIELARGEAKAAKAALAIFAQSEFKQALTDLADFCVERAY